MKKIQINVKEDIYEAYQELCRAKGSSVAVEVRLMMAKAVEDSKKQ